MHERVAANDLCALRVNRVQLVHPLRRPERQRGHEALAVVGAGALAARDLKQPLTPLEPFLVFKDGLLWPAALPALAHTLGVSNPAGG